MRKTAWALSLHTVLTNETPQNGLCPPGHDSWCKYFKHEETGEVYDHPHNLPYAVMETIKPVFQDIKPKVCVKLSP
jgi:hypothetical protein